MSTAAYQPNWHSLARHATPAWLRDAKLGIYCHWGLATVQKLPGNEDKHFRELIPEFTGERFEVEEWAALFAASGATYAGPVAWHGHGFVHWQSDVTPRNSAAQGPRRDIVAELGHAIRARGMKLLTSYHFGYWYAFPRWHGDPEYLNPDYTGLYGPIHDADLTDVVMWQNHIEKQAKPHGE